MLSASPSTPEQLAELMAGHAQAGRSIRLGGAFTKNRFGGTPARAEVCISTGALNRVRQYEPGDLTISVEAGTAWTALCDLLGRHGQMLPLDPPYASAATIGGLVCANTCGPRRRQYGSARDHVIGMQFATLEGKLVETGGMVVKNVAGLDMGKLLIGSYGTLAAVTVINFKLTPVAPCSRTFLLGAPSAETAFSARDRLLAGVLQPAAIDYLNPHAAARIGLERHVLLAQAAGNERVIERWSRELDGWQPVEDSSEERLWEKVREFTPHFLDEHEFGAVARLAVTLSELGAVAAAAPVPLLARAGSGVCYAYFPDVEAAARWLRGAARWGWRGVLECIPPQRCSPAEQWPAPGTDFELMRRIKDMLDPHHLLNRGRLYGRI